jgi:hypothetical protein
MGYIICNSPMTDGRLGVDGHDLTNLVSTASIDPSFITTQPQARQRITTDG